MIEAHDIICLTIVYRSSTICIYKEANMFEPKFNITSKLLGNIKRIGVIVADLNNRHFSKLTLVKLEKTAREVSAHSSTSIEGNPLPLTDVKKIIKNRPE